MEMNPPMVGLRGEEDYRFPIRGGGTAFDKKSQRGQNKTETQHNFYSGFDLRLQFETIAAKQEQVEEQLYFHIGTMW